MHLPTIVEAFLLSGFLAAVGSLKHPAGLVVKSLFLSVLASFEVPVNWGPSLSLALLHRLQIPVVLLVCATSGTISVTSLAPINVPAQWDVSLFCSVLHRIEIPLTTARSCQLRLNRLFGCCLGLNMLAAA